MEVIQVIKKFIKLRFGEISGKGSSLYVDATEKRIIQSPRMFFE
jgi:hypothetical protein